jgi:hypothetical protein
MTNGELDEKMGKIADQATVLVIASEFDKSKVDAGLWNELCRMCREVEDYV